MRIPIIDIGNSKGIRIPQAVLKQVLFHGEVEMDVAEGKIVLHRPVTITAVPDFEDIVKMDDRTIQQMLKKMNGTDLITALIGAGNAVKQAIFRNLSERVKTYVQAKLKKLEKADARELIIEQSRNRISDAFMEVMQGE
jgi:antitoxin component of MazEF toxin-antitoxin module